MKCDPINMCCIENRNKINHFKHVFTTEHFLIILILNSPLCQKLTSISFVLELLWCPSCLSTTPEYTFKDGLDLYNLNDQRYMVLASNTVNWKRKFTEV